MTRPTLLPDGALALEELPPTLEITRHQLDRCAVRGRDPHGSGETAVLRTATRWASYALITYDPLWMVWTAERIADGDL